MCSVMLLMLLLPLVMLMIVMCSMMILVAVAVGDAHDAVADGDADDNQVLTDALDTDVDDVTIISVKSCPFLYLDHDSDPRHLLSKGALARLTNSDGLTAEVDLIKISMIITSILMMITMN